MLLYELKMPTGKLLDYHKTLSPKLWDGNELKPAVLTALRKIAAAFIKTLDVPSNAVSDIIITGSLCNYNYTKYSDIDLHIVLDYSRMHDCDLSRIEDIMRAKKTLWNEKNDVNIYGFPVELYAEPIETEHTDDAGIYSISKAKWLNEPEKLTVVTYNENFLKKKAKRLMIEIESCIDEKIKDINIINKLQNRIKNMRKAGLERAGEFSTENLIFKMLRNSGHIKQLYDYEQKLKNHALSLETS